MNSMIIQPMIFCKMSLWNVPNMWENENLPSKIRIGAKLQTCIYKSIGIKLIPDLLEELTDLITPIKKCVFSGTNFKQELKYESIPWIQIDSKMKNSYHLLDCWIRIF